MCCNRNISVATHSADEMVFGHFGQELSTKLSHLHPGLYRNATEKDNPRKGLFVSLIMVW